MPVSSQWFANPGVSYSISQSIRFNDDDSAHLSRTPGSAGNRKTWTFSAWVKRANLTGGRQMIFSSAGGAYLQLGPDAASREMITIINEGSGTDLNWYTTQVFRDPGAWFHAVWQFDSTQASADNRTKLFINGSQVTDFTKAATPDQEFEGAINNAVEHKIGEAHHTTTFYLDAYLAEIHFIDGTAKEASDFGETSSTTGQWIPKKYSGSYGTNGFYITGEDSADLGDDESGNGNDFSSSGLAAADQVSDSPTNNFCTWNAIDAGSGTLSDGNLVLASTTDRTGTFAMQSGKWAWKITTAASGAFGIVADSLTGTETTYSAGSGEVLEFQLDLSAGTLEVSVDGGSYSSVASSLSGIFFPLAKAACTADFGQSGFTRDDTTFNYLSTSSLSPAVKDSSTAFQTTLYTGNGSTQSITNGGNSDLQPDLIWIKNRDASDSSVITDAVRGVTKILASDANTAEATDADTVTAFASDGFALGDDDKVNTNTEKYVSWNWKESATNGFDIVSFTGNATARTISHSLGVAPRLMMVKNLADSDNWAVYHASMAADPQTDYLSLNTNSNITDDSTVWNDTAPTSSVFSVGSSSLTNGNTEAMIAYLFAEVDGLSSFRKYTGNSNANGTFVHTGHRPSLIIIKELATEDWVIYDTKRNPINESKTVLRVDSNTTEYTGSGREIDILSNGFKLRTSNATLNSSGDFIYMSWSETPFKTARAR